LQEQRKQPLQLKQWSVTAKSESHGIGETANAAFQVASAVVLPEAGSQNADDEVSKDNLR
jgi:hypothetical protein